MSLWLCAKKSRITFKRGNLASKAISVQIFFTQKFVDSGIFQLVLAVWIVLQFRVTDGVEKCLPGSDVLMHGQDQMSHGRCHQFEPGDHMAKGQNNRHLSMSVICVSYL
ncbi:hypothetical protein GOODEAATRI_012508 [Goodea atripinnis]|uniref:Uncharacterized protein n=1 Tax=Goodea atripinnis TaxID=208336 RepID=A0ABV0PMZ6_9TELE